MLPECSGGFPIRVRIKDPRRVCSVTLDTYTVNAQAFWEPEIYVRAADVRYVSFANSCALLTLCNYN